MPITTACNSGRMFHVMRYAKAGLLVFTLFVSCSAALRAQTVQIVLVNGKTGHPLTSISWWSPRITVRVGVGHRSDLSLVLTADKRGVIPLRFTRDESEIDVPDCKGKREAWNELVKSGNKKDVQEFNKRYKNCTNFPANNPVVGLADSISIGPIIAGNNYFRYVQCWAGFPTYFSTEELLQHGIVTANNCGKATASPQPGKLILFVRLPTQMEAGRQAWN